MSRLSLPHLLRGLAVFLPLAAGAGFLANCMGGRSGVELARTPRIGYLSPVGANQISPSQAAFQYALAELGYVDGQTVEIVHRFVREGESAALPSMAVELVDMQVDVIVALGVARVKAAKLATDKIPIVMVDVAEPVETGLITSMTRPGGNVTGVGTHSTRLVGKRLELLKGAVPRLSRVAVLATPLWRVPNSPAGLQWRAVQEAAEILQVELRLVEVRDEGSGPATVAALERAIEAAARDDAEALLPLADAVFDIHRTAIARAATMNKLPTMYRRADFAEAGGLMAYGPNTLDTFRRVALYVDQILRGAKPAELPVVEPTRFDLTVNLKAADGLGVTVSPRVLVQASRVIE